VEISPPPQNELLGVGVVGASRVWGHRGCLGVPVVGSSVGSPPPSQVWGQTPACHHLAPTLAQTPTTLWGPWQGPTAPGLGAGWGAMVGGRTRCGAGSQGCRVGNREREGGREKKGINPIHVSALSRGVNSHQMPASAPAPRRRQTNPSALLPPQPPAPPALFFCRSYPKGAGGGWEGGLADLPCPHPSPWSMGPCSGCGR